MNHQSISFGHFMDRLYSIDCAHPGSRMSDNNQINTKDFRAFHERGTMVHVYIHRDGLNYVRFVPSHCVGWLFDAYGH